MLKMLQQQAQLQNTQLADAEKIRAEASLLIAQSKKSEADQKDTIKIAQMQQDMQQFMLKMRQDQSQYDQDTIKDLTELELKYGKDVPGAIV